MEPTIFGLNESQIAWLGLTVGVGLLMVYMLFIIGQLAWESKAGKFGTFVLYLALALSMVGFLTKLVIEQIIGHQVAKHQTSKPPAK